VTTDYFGERGNDMHSFNSSFSWALDRVICNNDLKTAYKELKRCIDGQM
jgi:hypothetical protein